MVGDLEYNGSSYPSIGVELELQLINPRTRDLSGKSIDLLQFCRKKGIPRIKAEVHQSMVEIETGVSFDVKQAREDLEQTLEELRWIARACDVEIAIAGTHPFQRWQESQIYPTQRYLYLQEKFQWLTRRMNVYGLHVHVGVESSDKAIAIMNHLVHYLPYLLALSSNSPYWDGEDTGLCSCRVGIMEAFPFAGMPKHFKNWKEFSHFFYTLRRMSAISSLKDLYWHVRPNPGYGTIEIRVCDGISTLSETMSIVALIQALVVWIGENLDSFSSSEKLRWVFPENLWSAARDGLNASLIVDEKGTRRPVAEEIVGLVDLLQPLAKRLNSVEELQGVVSMVNRGSGAVRQREVFHATHDLREVVDNLILELANDIAVTSLAESLKR